MKIKTLLGLLIVVLLLSLTGCIEQNPMGNMDVLKVVEERYNKDFEYVEGYLNDGFTSPNSQGIYFKDMESNQKYIAVSVYDPETKICTIKDNYLISYFYKDIENLINPILESNFSTFKIYIDPGYSLKELESNVSFDVFMENTEFLDIEVLIPLNEVNDEVFKSIMNDLIGYSNIVIEFVGVSESYYSGYDMNRGVPVSSYTIETPRIVQKFYNTDGELEHISRFTLCGSLNMNHINSYRLRPSDAYGFEDLKDSELDKITDLEYFIDIINSKSIDYIGDVSEINSNLLKELGVIIDGDMLKLENNSLDITEDVEIMDNESIENNSVENKYEISDETDWVVKDFEPIKKD